MGEEQASSDGGHGSVADERNATHQSAVFRQLESEGELGFSWPPKDPVPDAAQAFMLI